MKLPLMLAMLAAYGCASSSSTSGKQNVEKTVYLTKDTALYQHRIIPLQFALDTNLDDVYGFRKVKLLPKGTCLEISNPRQRRNFLYGIYTSVADVKVPYKTWYCDSVVIAYGSDGISSFEPHKVTLDEVEGPWAIACEPGEVKKSSIVVVDGAPGHQRWLFHEGRLKLIPGSQTAHGNTTSTHQSSRHAAEND